MREAGQVRRAKDRRAGAGTRLEQPGSPRRSAPRRRITQTSSRAELSESAGKTNLVPARATRFFGRDTELADVREQLLTPDVRLLTLTGPPGIGKSRLALEATRALREKFANGIVFVDLTPIRDPALVAHAIALRLGLTRFSRPVVEQLTHFLREKRLLLLLDNFEHVVDASLMVAELLGACPSLSILATSREPLRIDWEREYLVPPLTLPADLGHLPEAGRLVAYSAIALFVDRARAVHPRFVLDRHNARTVTEICSRLDGLPLAIEMAAALVKALSPQAMSERLAHGLMQLTAGARNLPERHQTLRGAIAWSYSLLKPDEQKLFRGLAVFVGGATLDAAKAVCADHDAGEMDLFGALASLVDKSLLRQEPQPDGQPRYYFLESIREFALEQLISAGDLHRMQQRHAAHFLFWVQQAEPALDTREQSLWLNRLEWDHDNLREVLRWSIAEPGRRETGLRVAGALLWFWWIRGYMTEGTRWLQTLLARVDGDVEPAVRAKACHAAAFLAYRLGDLQEAQRLSEQSLLVWRQLGDTPGIAQALNNLGRVALSQHEYALAQSLLQDALALHQQLGDRAESAYAINGLGELARINGDLEQARALYEEALSIWKETGNTEMAAVVLFNLAQTAMRQRDLHRARSCLGESVQLHKEVSSQYLVNCSLVGLAELAAHEGRARQAARLFGAQDMLSEAYRETMNPPDQAAYDASMTMTRAALTEEEFAAAWSEGRSMTLAQALDDGLSSPAEVEKDPHGKRKTTLTRREQEVAALVAQGLSNRAIATHLFIAERTAETHVENILNKLGFHSRAQIAAWTSQHRSA